MTEHPHKRFLNLWADKPRWPDGAWLIPATALGVAMWVAVFWIGGWW